MANYDYRAGEKRVEEILSNKLEQVDCDNFPKRDVLTFKNAYYSWITAIFVDIRDSSTLFSDENKEKVSKIIRSFTSEIIEILRSGIDSQEDKNMREIGIRGDCVYAIYTTPSKDDIYELADKTIYINTYMKMLNKLLVRYGLPKIRVGIGMSSDKELIIKAGRYGADINNKVWIGKAVTRAANFSSMANKFYEGEFNKEIIYSRVSFNNFIDQLEKNDPESNPREWFEYRYDEKNGGYYTASLIKTEFNKWIENEL